MENYWHKYIKTKKHLPIAHQQAITRMVCNMGNPKLKSVNVTDFKEDYLLKLKEDRGIKTSELVKQIKNDYGINISRETLNRTIKRPAKNSDKYEALSEILDVPTEYLKTGIVYAQREDGKKYISEIHRNSTKYDISRISTDTYERDCFEVLPTEVKSSIIEYIRELSTLLV